MIEAVLERSNKLSRKSAGESGEEQLLAANLDILFLITSLNLDLKPSRLERFLAAAVFTASELGRFDVVHARFVLEHVQDPVQVVRQMAAAARPGGRVVLADDDHQVFRAWPEPAGFAELWQAYIAAYQHLGCDPFGM